MGLPQGLALNPFSFAVVLDRLTDEGRMKWEGWKQEGCLNYDVQRRHCDLS